MSSRLPRLLRGIILIELLAVIAIIVDSNPQPSGNGRQ